MKQALHQHRQGPSALGQAGLAQDVAIPIACALNEARGAAAVARDLISVVAVLAWIEHVVAASSGSGGGEAIEPHVANDGKLGAWIREVGPAAAQDIRVGAWGQREEARAVVWGEVIVVSGSWLEGGYLLQIDAPLIARQIRVGGAPVALPHISQ